MITTQFLLAGNAIFTVTNVKRQTRLTFKVERPDNFRGEYFASVMKGSDNENDYRYVGMINEREVTLRETKGSKFRAGSPEFDGLALVLAIIAGRRPATDLLTIQHAGKCGRCARTLTVPESIESGIGPECAEKLGLAVPRVTKPVTRENRPVKPAHIAPDDDELYGADAPRIQQDRANEDVPDVELPAAPTRKASGRYGSLLALAQQLEVRAPEPFHATASAAELDPNYGADPEPGVNYREIVGF